MISTQDHYARDFPQGPPPEPQMLLPPLEEDEHQPPPPRHQQKKPRRVKRPRREKNCGFCQGSDERNKEGVPEAMLSCSNCGRSGRRHYHHVKPNQLILICTFIGHPTCLDIVEILDTVLTYQWTCIECRACEICHDKGDDVRTFYESHGPTIIKCADLRLLITDEASLL